MSTLTASIADFYMTSAWTCLNGAIVSGPTQVTAYKQAVISGLPADSVVTGASLSVSVGSPLSGIDVLKINGVSASAGTHTQNISISGNGTITIPFVFRANGDPTQSDGEHSGSVTLTNCVITVSYETGVTPPEPSPEVLAESENLVCLFAKDEKLFSGNGICVLSPTRCVVRESAGGYYELEMQHPFDQYGKWELIEAESIIRAPVPPNAIPAITLPAASVWQVKSSVTSTPLYTVLPHYTAAKTELDLVLNNPSDYAWQAIAYDKDVYCTYQGAIYQAAHNVIPGRYPGYADDWNYIMDIDGSGGSSGGIYDPGVIAEMIAGEELITKIADYNGQYMQARSLRGVVGYIARADCEQTQQSASGHVIPARTIKTQLFRVYRIECEDDTFIIKVYARHISYDFQHNTLLDCELVEADPATALAILQGSLLMDDSRLIACNITGQKLSFDWSFKNPVFALLDPDSGLVPFLDAKLIRDNVDYFILDNSTPRHGPRIKYGVNMLGVHWSRGIEDVITRIVPRCGDGNNGYLYLDELFVDSPVINEYDVIRIEVLDCEFSVGQQEKHADGTTKTLTRDDCLRMMRERAEKRFSVDKADAMEISLDVQFVLLGDTEEYRQYKGLQWLNLYDEIQIDTGVSGVSVTARVSEYEWDCLMKRFNEIKIGNVISANKRRIPGYRMNDKTITYSKLAPGLISKIRSDANV